MAATLANSELNSSTSCSIPRAIMARSQLPAWVLDRVFLASGPDLIEQVLVTDAKHYIKHFGARAFKPVLGNELVTSEGALWQRQRKLVQPAFLKTRVQTYAPVMAELTDRVLNSWTSGVVAG